MLAETAGLLADADGAAVVYALLRPWAALNVVDQAEGIRGSASRYLGILATTSQRWGEAALHFEDAIGMNARTGARPWLAHTQRDYARMLLERGRQRDRGRARDLLDHADTTYRALDMDRQAPGGG